MGQILQLNLWQEKNAKVQAGIELADLVDSWCRDGRVSWQQARQFRQVMTHQVTQTIKESK